MRSYGREQLNGSGYCLGLTQRGNEGLTRAVGSGQSNDELQFPSSIFTSSSTSLNSESLIPRTAGLMRS